MSNLKIGILDFGTITPDKTSPQVLKESLILAERADKLAYSRYWLTEHHTDTSSWASPEIMASQIARATKNIRVGTASVLLNLYSPFKVAENFRLLEALFPGRIDLGVGRGIVGEIKFNALVGKRSESTDPEKIYRKKLETLLGHLRDDFPSSSPFNTIRATPVDAGIPELWLNGTGEYSLSLAAELGLCFSYAIFLHKKEINKKTMRKYYENFSPGKELKSPKANIAVTGICAEDERSVKRIKNGIFNNSFRICKNRSGDKRYVPFGS